MLLTNKWQFFFQNKKNKINSDLYHQILDFQVYSTSLTFEEFQKIETKLKLKSTKKKDFGNNFSLIWIKLVIF